RHRKGCFQEVPTPPAPPSLVFTVHHSLAAAEARWRSLEPRAVLTPYQRFDWIAAYCNAGFVAEATLRIVEIDEAGRPVAMIPLAIAPWLGAARGQMIGSEIANGDAIVLDRERAAVVTPEVIARALDAVRADGTALDLAL